MLQVSEEYMQGCVCAVARHSVLTFLPDCDPRLSPQNDTAAAVNNISRHLMTIYGIGGVSGTGKTYFRTTCEGLREARALDIADVYEESIAHGRPDLHWRTALEHFEAWVRELLEEDRSSDIVLEAFFRPDGLQRQAIEGLAQEFGVGVR